jgi:hypothetical protein
VALYNLQQQEVNSAADKGRYEEALRLLSKFRPSAERDSLVTQVLDQMSPRVKKQLALQYLAQGKNIISTSARAEDQEQMNNLLALAGVFARYDVNQAFEIVEPLLEQFNEVSAAAVTMNGFDRDYYREGELVGSNENPVSQLANQFSDTLATLAMFDFDRAKIAAEGLTGSTCVSGPSCSSRSVRWKFLWNQKSQWDITRTNSRAPALLDAAAFETRESFQVDVVTNGRSTFTARCLGNFLFSDRFIRGGADGTAVRGDCAHCRFAEKGNRSRNSGFQHSHDRTFQCGAAPISHDQRAVA